MSIAIRHNDSPERRPEWRFRFRSARSPQVAFRRHLEFLRPVSSHLGNRSAQSLARRTHRPLSALSLGQQQMLRRRRSAHQLRRLPRSSPRRHSRGLFLRPPMSGLSFRFDPSFVRCRCFFNPGISESSDPCENLPKRQGGLRQLSHAQDKAPQRTHDFHRSPDSSGKARRTVPELRDAGLKRSSRARNLALRLCLSDVECVVFQLRQAL